MYLAGWSKEEIGIEPQGYAMHGFGNPKHKALGVRNTLQSRCFYITEQDSDAAPLIYVCMDLGYITHAIREGVIAQLNQHWGAEWDETRLVLTCTHTHSGPGGCTQDALYNMATPGYQPQHVEKCVEAAVQSILTAQQHQAPTKLFFSQAPIADDIPVAWNRSIGPYNCNPDVTPRSKNETHLALDRVMYLIHFERDGEVQALLSLFGVHATALGNSLHNHDGDNKGYAALFAEQALQQRGVERPVAIFAQSVCGDVSPHYQGPGKMRRRRKLKGDAEYAYAEANGRKQSDHALAMLTQAESVAISGAIDGVLTYADLSQQKADPEFARGKENAYTTPPCHGVAFFGGTPVDGPGMPKPLVLGAKLIANIVRKRRLKNKNSDGYAYYKRLYASQGPKHILMESERKQVLGYDFAKIPLPNFSDPLVKEIKQQARAGALDKSPMVPSVLPLQIVRLGNVTLVCPPGEFTTVSGQRLLTALEKHLPTDEQHFNVVCTYSNDYMGYVTTYEEYQEQAYEGGHTVYGQWTLAAFQTCFAKLAQVIATPVAEREYDTVTRPAPVSENELALRTSLPPR